MQVLLLRRVDAGLMRPVERHSLETGHARGFVSGTPRVQGAPEGGVAARPQREPRPGRARHAEQVPAADPLAGRTPLRFTHAQVAFNPHQVETTLRAAVRVASR